MAYSNLGLVHKKELRLKDAMECYEESLTLALKHKNKYAQGEWSYLNFQSQDITSSFSIKKFKRNVNCDNWIWFDG